MAFVSANTYLAKVRADYLGFRDGGCMIRAICGDSYFGLNTEEAVKLRDDLSRAITEAATAAAKAVQPEVVSA